MDNAMPIYQLADGIVFADVEGESVLMSVDSSRYFGVRGASRALLEPLRDGMSRADMITLLCARFDVSARDAANDIDAMLPKLLEAGIIASTANAV